MCNQATQTAFASLVANTDTTLTLRVKDAPADYHVVMKVRNLCYDKLGNFRLRVLPDTRPYYAYRYNRAAGIIKWKVRLVNKTSTIAFDAPAKGVCPRPSSYCTAPRGCTVALVNMANTICPTFCLDMGA